MDDLAEQRIRFWRRRHAEATERIKELNRQRRAQYEQAGYPDAAQRAAEHAHDDLARHEHLRLPLGMLYDSINCLGRPPTAAELFEVANEGMGLLYCALLWQGDDEPEQTKFLDELRETWGAGVVDAAIAEYDRCVSGEDERGFEPPLEPPF